VLTNHHQADDNPAFADALFVGGCSLMRDPKSLGICSRIKPFVVGDFWVELLHEIWRRIEGCLDTQ